jgi:hypothetical protein
MPSMRHVRRTPAPELYPCRYGGSRLVFRGPEVALRRPYAVVLGGSDAYGRHVEETFVDWAAEAAGMPVVNLGVHCGGLDVFARDAGLAKVVDGAAVVVIQAMSAANLSNRFYAVHPRRNDRFLRHAPALASLFPEVEFCDFSFTRHLLVGLRRASPDKCAIVARELGEAWAARMRTLLGRVGPRAVLLRIDGPADPELGPEPLMVDAACWEAVAAAADRVLRVDVSHALGADRLEGMVFGEFERRAAEAALPVRAHEAVGRALGEVLRTAAARAA